MAMHLPAERAKVPLAPNMWVRLIRIYVCHGNIIRALVCTIFNIPLGRWHHLPIYHASVTRFAVEGDGEKKFLAYNETGHLPPQLKTGTGFEESFY